MEFHVLINGIKKVVTESQLKLLHESKDKIQLDEEWYDAHGYVSWEDFKKKHPLK